MTNRRLVPIKTNPLKRNELNFSDYSLSPSILTELCGKRLEKYEDLFILFSFLNRLRKNRGTQREYSSKPLRHSIVQRIMVFER